MKDLRLLVRKTLRDILRSKLRSVSIVLAIMLSVSLGIGLVNATYGAIRSFDSRLEATNYMDLSIIFDRSVIDVSEIEEMPSVERALPRNFILTRATYSGADYKAHIISSAFDPDPPYADINGLQLVKGRYLSSPDAMECIIGNQFARERGVGLGDRISILSDPDPVELSVVGIAASPEYLYVIDEAGWPQPSLLVPVFVSDQVAWDAFGLENDTYEQLLIDLDEDADEEATRTILRILIGQGISVRSVTPGPQSPDYAFSRTDAEAMGQTGWAFGLIIMMVTAVVIYNSLTRLIHSQRTYIGVMMAMGGKKGYIVSHYTLFGSFLGLAGALPGILFGYLLSYVTVLAYADVIGLVDPVTDLNPTYPLIFAILGVAISTAAAALGAFRILRIGPREALYSSYRTVDFNKKPFMERFLQPFIGNRVLPRMIVRDISRHRVRTLMTVCALSVSLVLVFASISMVVGFTRPLERNYEEYEMFDARVVLSEGMSWSSLRQALNASELDIVAEPAMEEFVTLHSSESMHFVKLQAYIRDTKLRNYNVIEGSEDLDRGALMGSKLARDLSVEVGDRVTIGLGSSNASLIIVGITGELMDDSIMMDLDKALSLKGERALIDTFVIGGLDDGERSEFEEAMRLALPVSNIVYSSDVLHGMEAMMQGITAILYIFILFGVLAEVLFIGTTVTLGILDRQDDLVNLRAMGVRPMSIRRMLVLETAGLIIISFIIGFPLAYYATVWSFAYIARDIMYFVLEIPVFVYFATAAIALLTGLITAFISAWHIGKLHIALHIRNRLTA